MLLLNTYTVPWFRPVSTQEQHLLYPELGLDIVLNTDGMDDLQYLSPADFDTHRTQLQVKED